MNIPKIPALAAAICSGDMVCDVWPVCVPDVCPPKEAIGVAILDRRP